MRKKDRIGVGKERERKEKTTKGKDRGGEGM